MALARIEVKSNAGSFTQVATTSPISVDLATVSGIAECFYNASSTLKSVILNRLLIKVTDDSGLNNNDGVPLYLCKDLHRLLIANTAAAATFVITSSTQFNQIFPSDAILKVKMWNPVTYDDNSNVVLASLDANKVTDLFATIKFGAVISYVNNNNVTTVKFTDLTNSTSIWKTSVSSTRVAIAQTGSSALSTVNVSLIEGTAATGFEKEAFTYGSKKILTELGIDITDIKMHVSGVLVNYVAPIAYIGNTGSSPVGYSLLTDSAGLVLKYMFKREGAYTLNTAIKNTDTTNNNETYAESDHGWVGEYLSGLNTNDTSITITVT